MAPTFEVSAVTTWETVRIHQCLKGCFMSGNNEVMVSKDLQIAVVAFVDGDCHEVLLSEIDRHHILNHVLSQYEFVPLSQHKLCAIEKVESESNGCFE